jgi:hypothetical protein
MLSGHRVFVRECGNKLGMTSQFVRLVVRPQEDVNRLMDGMLSYMRSLVDEAEQSAELLRLPSSTGSLFAQTRSIPRTG